MYVRNTLGVFPRMTGDLMEPGAEKLGIVDIESLLPEA
jgi:hypothetical protein